MALKRRAILALAAAAATTRAHAAQTVRIGVLSSFTGEYADGAGQGSVVAARLAVEDAALRFPVDIVQADMLDKPEIGAGIAREWFDRGGVDAVIDVPNSSVALAVADIVRARNKVALFSGPGLAAISGARCSPNHVQWTYDTGALANGTARAVLAEGGRDWFFITADYSFGHGLQADAAAVVTAQGGRVLGSVAFPFPNTTDFAPFLLQAQASGAQVIGLACTGNNFSNVVKQSREFGLKARLASLLCLITNVHAIGLADAQGLLLTSPFYWDLNEGTRAFTARFRAQFHQPPTMVQAGAYSATRHYLRAVMEAGVVDGAAIVAAMKRMPADDPLFGRSIVRPNGSVIHDMHLFQVKAPGESSADWDFYRLLRTTPATQAFRPVNDSGCALPA